MSEIKQNNERFYWLKLKKDFFKRHDIKVIEGMENGKDYVLFYLKLLCESLDHNGNLRFSDTIPYSESMLASVTGTNIDVVRSAMKILVSLNLVEVLDDQTIFMREVEKMTGSETASTIRSRECRAKLPSAQPTDESPKSNAERQRAFRAKVSCEQVQHVPRVERYANQNRYSGNYYIVMKRDKFKCCICGSIERLCVHHIDGYDEQKPENNAENKMLVLCRCCHRQVHEGKPIPKEILDSIDYYENGDSNESNVTCNALATTRNVTATQEYRDKSIDNIYTTPKESILLVKGSTAVSKINEHLRKNCHLNFYLNRLNDDVKSNPKLQLHLDALNELVEILYSPSNKKDVEAVLQLTEEQFMKLFNKFISLLAGRTEIDDKKAYVWTSVYNALKGE